MWRPGERNAITVVGDQDLILKAYYKRKQSSDSFVELSPGFEYIGDSMHELITSFPEGDYIIRVDNLTIGRIKHLDLPVKPVPVDLYSKNTNNKVSQVLKKISRKGY